jgi:hypothetical protein
MEFTTTAVYDGAPMSGTYGSVYNTGLLLMDRALAFWTATQSPSATAPNYMYTSFGQGASATAPGSITVPVVCARRPVLHPDGGARFVTSTGYVTDTHTGLQWEEPPSDKEYILDVATVAYVNGTASAHCGSLTLGGHSDWRIPHAAELVTLVDYTRANPALYDGFTLDSELYHNYRSLTSAKSTCSTGDNSVCPVILDFSRGALEITPIATDSTSLAQRVRCVRSVK